jgi:hypothetical protein
MCQSSHLYMSAVSKFSVLARSVLFSSKGRLASSRDGCAICTDTNLTCVYWTLPLYASITPFEAMRTDSLLETGRLRVIDVSPQKADDLRQTRTSNAAAAIPKVIPLSTLLVEA